MLGNGAHPYLGFRVFQVGSSQPNHFPLARTPTNKQSKEDTGPEGSGSLSRLLSSSSFHTFPFLFTVLLLL
jgi:hypothetical protein